MFAFYEQNGCRMKKKTQKAKMNFVCTCDCVLFIVAFILVF